MRQRKEEEVRDKEGGAASGDSGKRMDGGRFKAGAVDRILPVGDGNPAGERKRTASGDTGEEGCR